MKHVKMSHSATGGSIIGQIQERQRMNSMLSEARKRSAAHFDNEDDDDGGLDQDVEEGAAAVALPRLSSRNKRAAFFDPAEAAQIYAQAQADRMAAGDGGEDGDSGQRDNTQEQEVIDVDAEHEAKTQLQGLPSRVEMRTEFGAACAREKCFGCVYNIASKRNTVAVFNDDLKELFDLPRNYMGQSCPKTIVKLMAERYMKIREQTNARARIDEDLLPEWREADIYECIYYHNLDPELQPMFRLFENGEMRRAIIETGIMEVNPKTGVTQVNQKALASLAKLQDMDGKLYGRDPKKQMFYSEGAKLNPGSLKQGAISTSKKNIKSFYQTGHYEPGSTMGIL